MIIYDIKIIKLNDKNLRPLKSTANNFNYFLTF